VKRAKTKGLTDIGALSRVDPTGTVMCRGKSTQKKSVSDRSRGRGSRNNVFTVYINVMG